MRWPSLSTTPDENVPIRRLRVTHAFHPQFGREFDIITFRQNWGDERVYVRGPRGQLLSLPIAWTTMGVPPPFVVISAGRSLFQFEDLLELNRLLEQLR